MSVSYIYIMILVILHTILPFLLPILPTQILVPNKSSSDSYISHIIFVCGSLCIMRVSCQSSSNQLLTGTIKSNYTHGKKWHTSTTTLTINNPKGRVPNMGYLEAQSYAGLMIVWKAVWKRDHLTKQWYPVPL